MELIQGFSDISLIFKLRQAAGLIEDKLLSECGAFEDGLDFRQLCVLNIIKKNPSTSTSDLSKILFCTQPAITQIISGLIKRGLIKKAKSKSDKRVRVLKLTSAAEEKVNTYGPKLLEFEQKIKRTMKDVDIDLYRVLNFFMGQLDANGEDHKPIVRVIEQSKQRLSIVDKPKLGKFQYSKSRVSLESFIKIIKSNYPKLNESELNSKLNGLNLSEVLNNALIFSGSKESAMISFQSISNTASEVLFFQSSTTSEVRSFLEHELVNYLDKIQAMGKIAVYVGLKSTDEDVLRIFIKEGFSIVSNENQQVHFGNLILRKLFNDF